VPTWPATLPQEPSETSFKETPPDLIVRSEMDAGPDKVRKRYTAGVRLFEVEYLFLPDQMTAWESFYENEISDGVLPFTYPHPRKWGTTISVRLRDVPQYKHEGAGVFRLTLNLEQLP
jgi:hypothetical protein